MHIFAGICMGMFLTLAVFFSVVGFVAVVGQFITIPPPAWVFLALLMLLGLSIGAIVGDSLE
jgi:hypothetical protein